MSIVEGMWDCKCGKKRIPGGTMVCPKCFLARGKDVEFYCPDDAREVTDEKELERARENPDWNCQACNAGNRFSNDTCSACGARKPVLWEENLHDVTKDRSQTRDDTNNSQKTSAVFSSLKSKLPITIIGASVAGVTLLSLLIYGIVYLFSSHPQEVKVTGFEWTQSINVEEYRTLTQTDWNVPVDGRVISTSQQVHHYDKVLDHVNHLNRVVYDKVQDGYETVKRTKSERVQDGTERVKVGSTKTSRGNGYYDSTPVYENRPKYKTVNREYSEQVAKYKQVPRNEPYDENVYVDVPIYKTKYTYLIDRWVDANPVSLNGTDKNPRWPEVSVSSTRRAANKHSSYIVYFSNKEGQRLSYETDLNSWQAFQVSEIYTAEVRNVGNTVVKILKAERR